jgi:hypothetical protein
MQRLLSKFKLLTFGEKLMVFGLFTMAIGLPTSRFLMSLSFLFMGLAWFAAPYRWTRFKSFFTWNSAFVFALCYAVVLLSLFWTDNFSYAWKDIKVKMPLLFIPYLLYTFPKLNRFWFLTIIKCFILATLVSCLSAIINWFKFQYGYFDEQLVDLRQISRFIDHIRLSLMIALSTLFMIYKGHEFKWLSLTVYAIVTFFISFLILTQYFTGLLALFVGVTGILLIRRNRLPKIWGIGLAVVILLGLFTTSQIIKQEHNHTFNVKDSTVNERIDLSRDGNPLHSVKEDLSTENGYYIYWNIQKEELRLEWQNRSNKTIYDLDHSGNKLYYTLIRFLSSKGEIKDAEAIRNLSDLEVAAIENGIPNTRFLEISGFSKRINQIMYQFKWYFEGGNPSGHSLTQRLEFLKAGWHIFKRNPLIGVGTGDLKDEFIKEYETGQTKLDKAFQKRTHNQFATFFITYGILGVSVILILFLIAIRMNTLRTSLYFLSFMIVFVVSCLNEDTLETQAGVSFFAFFFSLLMFARKEKQ